MTKVFKYLELLAALLLTIFYFESFYQEIATYFGLPIVQILPNLYYIYTLLFFFIIMTVESYLTTERRYVFPIIFLIVIAVLLFFPAYNLLTVSFLPVYVFKQYDEDVKNALSFVIVGFFLGHLLSILSFALLAYGWVKYIQATIKK